MTETIYLTIHGNPIPWAAARVCKGFHYDIRAKDKREIVQCLKNQYSGPMLLGALKVDYYFAMPILKTASKINRMAMIQGAIHHTKKPDRDNLQKLYSDTLERAGIMRNDSQIVDGASRKFYHEKPHVMIVIQQLES